tara:strand:+ start:6417 stop:6593 length:177 start_codon:yes stop_codon:yes gene_type:complete
MQYTELDSLDLREKLAQLTTEDQIMLAWLVYRLGDASETWDNVFRESTGQQGFRQSFV